MTMQYNQPIQQNSDEMYYEHLIHPFSERATLPIIYHIVIDIYIGMCV